MTIAEKKRALLEKKANDGDARAQYELGLLHYRGDGVPRDILVARHWLEKAAEQGQRDASVLLKLRGLQLNEGVEFKFGGGGGTGRSVPYRAQEQAESDDAVDESELYTCEPKPAGMSAAQLEQELRDALARTQNLVPDKEAVKDRLIAMLTAMLKQLQSRRMPAKSERGRITMSKAALDDGLLRCRGQWVEGYKANIIRLSLAFMEVDVKPPVIVKPRPKPQHMDKHALVASIADQIEAELRHIGWWREEPPVDEVMNFKEAFGMDTMPFSTWIQFVLLVRIREIIAQRGGFPSRSMVGTHAVREYDGQDEAAKLVSLLCELDEAAERK